MSSTPLPPSLPSLPFPSPRATTIINRFCVLIIHQQTTVGRCLLDVNGVRCRVALVGVTRGVSPRSVVTRVHLAYHSGCWEPECSLHRKDIIADPSPADAQFVFPEAGAVLQPLPSVSPARVALGYVSGRGPADLGMRVFASSGNPLASPSLPSCLGWSLTQICEWRSPWNDSRLLCSSRVL